MKKSLAIWILVGVSVAVYSNTLANLFAMDDGLYILENPTVTEPTLHKFFQTNGFSNVFRPVTFATLAANYRTSREHPIGYHATNILLEAAVPVLLYFLLTVLLEPLEGAANIAFAAALIFAVHPIHTEAVASAANRSEILAAGFVFAAWLLHLKGRPWTALACFVAALLSKESAVVFLPLIIVADYVRGNWKPISRYATLAGTTLLYIGVLWKVKGGHLGNQDTVFLDNPLMHLPPTLRLANAIRVGWKYIGLLIYPKTLSMDYSYNAIPLYSHWTQLLPALLAALAALGLWLWALKTKRMPWAIAGAIYFIGFSVTANILIPTGTIMGERLAYLSSAGFCLGAALLWWKLAERNRKVAWIVLCIALAALGLRTYARNRDWSNDATLSAAGVAAEPGSSKLRANLAVAELQEGKFADAKKNVQIALQIYPDSADAIETLAVLEFRTGHPDDARRDFQKVYDMTPSSDIHFALKTVNLAGLLIKNGDAEEALRLLDHVAQTSPEYPRTYAVRAVLHYKAGDLADARNDAENAARLDPQNLEFVRLAALFSSKTSKN